MVLVHELGHFIAARKSGIFVEEFAIGMGPKLWSTKTKKNKTVYSLRLLPIGGFCKMLGEDEDHPGDTRALNNKKVWQRILVMAAGAIMNFLLAFLIYFGLNLFTGYPVAEVRETLPNTPASESLLAGDKITHINGSHVGLYEDFSFELLYSGGEPVDIRVNRDGEIIDLQITPALNEFGEPKLGFYPGARLGLFDEIPEGYGYERVGFFGTVSTSFNKVIFIVKSTVVGIYRLVTGQGGLVGLSGPIGIANEIGNVYDSTIEASERVQASAFQTFLSAFITMLEICALISANLGIMNLLPLPALDGGRLVFLIYEGIRRKPVPPEREGTVHFVGFVLLMILAVFVAYQDIVKLL